MEAKGTGRNPLECFREEAPEVAAAFDGLVQALAASPGLDSKTKHLVYIGIKASMGDAVAVKFHAPMAKHFGATRGEVRDAVLITLTTSGLQGVATCLEAALDAYDKA